ncbi:mobile mystery protein B [Phyllobacterium chamaecytisi]|uniref:mobile mystery protein B n=1 Tax=Phyllobacterium chamaecytisi TaxID=2876082 RepID=UPI001CCE77B4|nr:mobile mystery protein B [Phyllobacterium sp. KW56]MBZ9602152.1 mobile mystery protein B [Phyllobacterium sp. KW56]
MTEVLFDAEDNGATALEPDERAQLIPTYISTRAELNDAELQNINDADRWVFRRRRDVLSLEFLKNLHKRMFNQVWRWAGNYRTTGRNIGVEAYRIDTELHQLLSDVRFWIANTTFLPDEIAIRFHHRLVAIHPFPNGNGRHARLAADLLIIQLGNRRFTWGSESLVEPAKTRHNYIKALRTADNHDIRALLAFART